MWLGPVIPEKTKSSQASRKLGRQWGQAADWSHIPICKCFNLRNCLYTVFFLYLYMPVHLLWVLGVSASVVELPYTASSSPAAEEETDSTYYGYSHFLLLFSFSFEMTSAMPQISLIPLFHSQIQNTKKPSSFCRWQKKDFNEPNILSHGPEEWLCMCVLGQLTTQLTPEASSNPLCLHMTTQHGNRSNPGKPKLGIDIHSFIHSFPPSLSPSSSHCNLV